MDTQAVLLYHFFFHRKAESLGSERMLSWPRWLPGLNKKASFLVIFFLTVENNARDQIRELYGNVRSYKQQLSAASVSYLVLPAETDN